MAEEIKEVSKVETPDETKTNSPELEEPEKEVVGPARGGLMKRTLKELEKLEIQLSDVFIVGKVGLNLSWTQVIRLVNYNAEKTVLRWEHTFEEALELIQIFLM